MENKELVKETEKKNTPLFILKIVGNVLFYAVIITLLLFSIMNINAGSKNGGFPNIFGRGFLSVQSNSMQKNGNNLTSDYDSYEIGHFSKGDLLLVKTVSSKNLNELKEGDVITFFDTYINNLNSHRIVYIGRNADGEISSIAVQGDKSASELGVYGKTGNPAFDTMLEQKQTGQDEPYVIYLSGNGLENIKGVVTGVNSGAGRVLENIQQNWLWYFVLPVLVFLLFEVFMVVKNIMDLKGAKQKAELANDKEAMMADLEAQKEELRRQILAEMGIQQPTQQAETPKEEATTQVEEVKEEVQAEVEPEVQAEPEVTEKIKEEAVTTDAVVVEETTDAEVEPAQEETKEEAKEKPVADAVVTENVIQTLDEPSSITEVVPQEEVQAEAVEPEAQTEVVGVQENTEEVVEPAQEAKPTTTKKPAAKKTTTTAKKSSSSTTKKTTTSKTSTAKKASTSTAAKKSTATKKTTTKKTTE
ncbi:MAG: hypothetical protein MR357_06660 [Anaeroplasma sp.]|nr:hypothetical protein [Anaeroplasma sp.]